MSRPESTLAALLWRDDRPYDAPATCAAIAAVVQALLSSFGRSLAKSNGTLAIASITYSCLVTALYPFTHIVRSEIGKALFPYVTWVRFGAMGFYLHWTALHSSIHHG